MRNRAGYATASKIVTSSYGFLVETQLEPRRSTHRPRNDRDCQRSAGRDTGATAGREDMLTAWPMTARHQPPMLDPKGTGETCPLASRWQPEGVQGRSPCWGWQRRGNAPRGTPALMDSLDVDSFANGAMLRSARSPDAQPTCPQGASLYRYRRA